MLGCNSAFYIEMSLVILYIFPTYPKHILLRSRFPFFLKTMKTNMNNPYSYSG